MGGGEVLKKGALIKSPPLESGALKMWRRRWFVLLSSKVLEYYKSEGGEQKGVINLEDCRSVNSNLAHKRYKHVFNIETKGRVYFLVAKSQSDMESWVNALCRVCGLHTDDTPAFQTLPAYNLSKTKGHNITQPVYATSTRTNTYGHLTTTADSVYSLAAKSDYDVRERLHQSSTNTLTSSHDLPENDSSSGLGTKLPSAVSEESCDEVVQNRLSQMAYFSPRPVEGLGFLADTDLQVGDTSDRYGVPVRHRAVNKVMSATMAPSSHSDTSFGLQHRSKTNAAAYGGVHRQPPERLHASNSFTSLTTTSHGLPTFTRLSQLQESPFDATLDRESATREEGYGVLHMPPPVDRSRKPHQLSPTSPHKPRPPAINRGLKPGHLEVEPNLSDSSDESSSGLPEPNLADSLPPYTNLMQDNGSSSSTGSREEAEKEEQETQFSAAEIPCVTVCTTHYTQVDFNPDKRRPVPLPRKTSKASSLTPRPSQRINYTDVDIQATSELTDHLHRQMTVREAERKALSEKQYINVDRSGIVDDETDPDYYTYMRDMTYHDADRPGYIFARPMMQSKETMLVVLSLTIRPVTLFSCHCSPRSWALAKMCDSHRIFSHVIDTVGLGIVQDSDNSQLPQFQF